ncbi:MAG: hypothetical protein ACD_51C00361G0004 [uncultured bacterium]|nr:MAG: hypothetical protein ACD_51C00361G0004 [uncultured bacterium]
MNHEDKNTNLEAIAEQWVNLLFAHIEANKQQEIINIEDENEE